MFDDFDTCTASPIELKSSATDDAGRISGYLAAFDGPPDSYGDVIRPGAFAKTLQEHKAAGRGLPMLWSHQTSQPIGRWSDLAEDAHGLKATGALNLATARGREAHAHIKAGDVTGLSIGYVAPAHGQTRVGGLRTLHELHLLEGSVVATPANGRTRIMEVKSLANSRELETLLIDGGLSRGAARKFASGGWPALSGAQSQADFDAIAARINAAAQTLRS